MAPRQTGKSKMNEIMNHRVERLGQQIALSRHILRLTRDDVAAEVGVSRNTVQRLEENEPGYCVSFRSFLAFEEWLRSKKPVLKQQLSVFDETAV